MDSGLLICFSHLRWDFVYQRPQHLLSRAAGAFQVLFFEEPVFDAEGPAWLEQKMRGDVRVLTPHLPRHSSAHEARARQTEFVAEILATFTTGQGPLIFWYYTPMALAFTREFDCDLCVYDVMDELAAFKNPPAGLMQLEVELFGRADLVFTGGRSLYESKRTRHRDVHLFASSIDFAHFARARHGSDEPSDQSSIPRPRVGFFGVIDERMDLDLVRSMAERAPDWHFIMIGPVVKIDPASLPSLPNLHWLGAKSYADLPDYLGGWDLGFMPFALNEATRFISPTKTPEFLAAGLPVLSTAVPDVVQPYGEAGLVAIARDAAEAVEVGRKLLPADRSARLRNVDRFLATTSWDHTWRGMHDLLTSRLLTRNSHTPPRTAPESHERIAGV